jgi:NADPH:quinone reductase-like Zn-dependent oxidoreductase
MKAMASGGFGAPPTLHDLPVREPGEGEVLVRVRTSSVNGLEVAVAGGSRKGMTGQHFPAGDGTLRAARVLRPRSRCLAWRQR